MAATSGRARTGLAHKGTARLGKFATWGVLGLLAGLMFSGVWLSRFSRDESQWIYTARYLTLFRQLDVASPEWNSYWTQTQPPFARYLMGMSLKAAGFDLLKLNGPWDFSKEDSDNARFGNMPSASMLFWGRLPIAALATGAVILVYLIGTQLGGTPGGIAAAAWLALNPRSRELMTRAESEGAIICLMLLGLWLAIKLVAACERSQRPSATWRDPLALTLILGLTVGLAASSKLTGGILPVALAGALFVDLAFRWMREAYLGPVLRRNALLRRLIATAATALGTTAVALLVFVLLNPALYAHPFRGLQDMLSYRQTEMQQQMALYQTAALQTPLERLEAAVIRPLFTYGTANELLGTVIGEDNSIAKWLPLDAFMVLAGLAAATRSLLHRFASMYGRTLGDPSGSSSTRGIEGAGVALVWTAVLFAGVAANLGLDWDRYVLPLTVMAALWAGAGTGWLWARVIRREAQTGLPGQQANPNESKATGAQAR